MIEEIIESFEIDKENRLLFSGFYQMYYMQTISEPEETLKDFKKRWYKLTWCLAFELTVILDGYDDNLDLVSSRTEEKEEEK